MLVMSSEPEPDFEISKLTDTCFVLRAGSNPSTSLSHQLIAFANAYREIDGVVEACAGHRTIMIECAPGAVARIKTASPVVDLADTDTARTHEVGVRYDGEDLDWVCSVTGLSRDEVVTRHSGRDYLVTMLGSPGFIYLSEVPESLVLPRQDLPRVKVPAGSVGIGGRQTGIYGLERPGGWRIIGIAPDVPDLGQGDIVRMVPS